MEGKVLLQDLAQSLATKRNLKSKDAETFLKAFFETISDGILQDSIVKIKGLGTFKMIEVQNRESVNVNTGERIVIPGHSKISFTPDTELKEQVNKPFALFQTVVINEGTSLEEMEKLNEQESSNDDVRLSGNILDDTEVYKEKDIHKEKNITSKMMATEEPLLLVDNQEEEKISDTSNDLNESEMSADDPHNLPTREHKWWYISSTMLALLFAFFWIVLLIGYLGGNKNWVAIDQFLNRKPSETIIKVDTVFVEKVVELDSAYIQGIEDSLRNIILEESKQKKELPKVKISQVIKAENKPIVTKKQTPTVYEIIGQKGVRTIKWGDYLLKIVREEYGNEDALKYVISYNKFINPNNLPVGTEVKLPKLRAK